VRRARVGGDSGIIGPSGDRAIEPSESKDNYPLRKVGCGFLKSIVVGLQPTVFLARGPWCPHLLMRLMWGTGCYRNLFRVAYIRRTDPY
jgi:hypothetical protein